MNQLLSAMWEEAHGLLEGHPVLLTPEVDDWFAAQFLKFSRPNEEHMNLLLYQQLLCNCRLFGIDEAFRDVLEPAQLTSMRMSMMFRPEEAGRRFIILLHLVGNEDYAKDSIQQARIWNDLAIALSAVQQGNREACLEHAIVVFRYVLTALTREEHPTDWAETMSNLGYVYLVRAHADSEDNLDRAIDCFRESLEILTPDEDYAIWANTQRNLALAFQRRTRGDSFENQTHSIRCYEALLGVCEPDEASPQRAEILHQLGAHHLIRGSRSPKDDLETAIGYLEEACELRSHYGTEIDRARSAMRLGTAYREWRLGPRGENLQRAIQWLEKALDGLEREDDTDLWCQASHNLAVAYLDRSRERGAEAEPAIELLRQVIPHLPIGQRLHAERNLAEGLLRVDGSQRISSLQRAREIFESLLQAEIRDPSERARIHGGLAKVFRDQFLPGNRTANLESALVHSRRAAELASPEECPEIWAEALLSVGNSLFMRTRALRRDNLIQAREAFEEVLAHAEFLPTDLVVQARVNLAATLIKWRDSSEDNEPDEDRKSRAESLEQAIEQCQLALAVVEREQTPRKWAEVQQVLGDAYNSRLRQDRGQNLEAAIEAYESAYEALDKIDPTSARRLALANSLAGAYRDRRRGSSEGNLQRSLELYKAALEATSLETELLHYRELQGNLGRLLFYLKEWHGATDAMSAAQAASEVLYAGAADEESRRAELQQSLEFPGRIAYSLARLDRLSEAVEILEEGRTRSLVQARRWEAQSSALGAEDRATLGRAKAKVEELQRQLRHLEDGESDRFVQLSQSLAQRRLEFDALTQRLGTASDPVEMGRSSTHLSFSEISALAGDLNKPLVYLAGTPHGSLALVVWPGSDDEPISSVWLDDFTSFDLRSQLGDENDSFRGYVHSLAAPESTAQFVEQLFPILEDSLMGPVVELVQAQGYPEVALIACGRLGLLPLGGAARSLAVSGTPSASFLAAALRNDPEGDRSVLVVGDPTASLEYGRLEAEIVASRFPEGERELLLGLEASLHNLRRYAHHASHLHFSCHGSYHPFRPLDSRLHLAGSDEPLSLTTLLDRELDALEAELVVLSACESAPFELERAPDEMVGMPAAFLQAGASGVVASLWPVEDLSTALLMDRFYRYHLGTATTSPTPPARSLQLAQRWLRGVTVESFRKEAFELRRSEPGSPTAKLMAEIIANFSSSALSQHPFEHPSHWAAFVYVGV